MQDEGMGQAEPEMGGAAAPSQQPPGVRPTHVERINSGNPTHTSRQPLDTRA